MEGYIDQQGEARVKVEVMGREIDAVIDTGFDGDLCLPIQIAVQLRLELTSVESFELADGSIKQELVFSGKTKLGEAEKDGWITLTESDDALLGTGMFSYLELDYEQETVKIS